TTISGVGKRLAERLTVELRGKLKVTAPATAAAARRRAEPDAFRDLRSALLNLQYRAKEIEAVLAQLQDEEPADAPFDALLRKALGHLRR
ncbi:MAG: Holliday junction branch migration protein RuvA, partial [Proteobacteria bacterium]